MGKRRAVVVTDEAETFTVTREQMYKAACTRSEPCGAHKDTVDKMIERIKRDDD